MQVGDRVFLHSYDGFRREVFIKESGVTRPDFDGLTCYKTNEGSFFYMKSEVGTGRYYNVGNRSFWLTRSRN